MRYLVACLLVAVSALLLRVHQLELALVEATAIRDGYAGEVADAREYIAHLTRRPPGVRK